MVEQYLEKGREALVAWAPSVVAALAILILGFVVAKMVGGLARRLLRKAHLDETLVSFLGNLIYALLLTLVVLAALGKLGVDTTSFAAVIAAAGLAIGFAMQGSLSNFAAGVMIIALRPFKVGDGIEVGGDYATVKDINIFATKLLTPDNKTLTVPNSQLTDDVIVNYTTQPTRRVDMVFGIGYEDDLKKAKEILERLVTEHELVLEDPAPKVFVKELADSSVNFAVRPWTKTEDYWTVHGDLLEQVKLTFDAEGISIPFPQADVHLHQVA